MTEVFRIPQRRVLERYDNLVWHRIVQRYHARLAKRHRWQVKRSYETVYVDTEFPPFDLFDDIHTIQDCNWSSDGWEKHPYAYHKDINGTILEKYCAERSDPPAQGPNGADVGYRINENGWLWKLYDEGFGGDSASVMTGWFNIYGWKIRNGSVITEYNGETGVFKQGLFSSMLTVDKPVSDFITPVLRKMNAKSQRGFYNEDIRWIIDTSKADTRHI